MQIHNLCTEERTKTILQKSSVASSLPPFLRKETPAFLKPVARGRGTPAGTQQTPGSLHVDGVCVLLAQGFVLLGVERLPLQIHMADLEGRQARVTERRAAQAGRRGRVSGLRHPFGKAPSRPRAGGQQAAAPLPRKS